MHSIANLISLPGLPQVRTYAPYPVWKNSTDAPIPWPRRTRRAMTRVWWNAREFERRTRQPGRQDGAIGRNGLAILQALIFDFLNYSTGRLDPSINAIANKAAISRSSVYRGLRKLKAAGVLTWIRRCSAIREDGRYTLRQDSNAYAIAEETRWHGYTPATAAPPAPHPTTWAAPVMPDARTAAIIEVGAGSGPVAVARVLETEPDDRLAGALARLGRTVAARQIR